ncbi:MAG TPA: hypothetical protein VEZ11_08900 [Thermoanaerobaculia bacterium]|nr:hypothetical protein [Thermoanaerobaculia bacterium]
MQTPNAVAATERYHRAIRAVCDLLARQRIDFAFLGGVARAAWLGGTVSSESLDVLVLINPEQKNQICMMAGNRGFRVDRDEVQATEELDLIPMTFIDSDGDVRVHILLASNALYGRMVASSMTTMVGEQTIKVPAREDLALLLGLSDDPESLRDRDALLAEADFDRRAYIVKLQSIGLGEIAAGL